METKPSLADRFWSKVDKRGPDDCWPWTGPTNVAGYGTARHNGQKAIASRVAWSLTHGAPTQGMLVCHRCDNPPCVNPAHLWLGTHRDNALDMVAKGRNKYPSLAGFHTDGIHCRQGHRYDEQRSYPSERGRLRCRICHYAAFKRRNGGTKVLKSGVSA